MRRGNRAGAWLLAGASLGLLVGGCGHDSTWRGKGGGSEASLVENFAASFDLGDALYRLIAARLDGSDPVSRARHAAFVARRDDFVAAVNTIVGRDTLQNAGATLGALIARVDDGTLPLLTDQLADTLEALATEPGQPTLRALLELTDGRGVLQPRDALRLGGQIVADPALEDLVAAFADLVERNDGRDASGAPNGEPDLVAEGVQLVRSLLAASAAGGASGSGSGLARALREELLAPAPPRRPGAFGAPAWIVLADPHGNPAVARDPATGTLWTPFVDADGDGAADVDASGRPVDAGGAPIAIPPFGPAGSPGYDAWGRALHPSGALLYRYRDAKETVLGHLLQLAGEGLRRGVGGKLSLVVETGLGPLVQHDAGTPGDPTDDYEGFGADGPLQDLAWGVLELGRRDETVALLGATAALLRSDPALAESVFVAFGKALERLRPVALAPRSTADLAAQRAFVDRLLALAARMLAQPSGGGRPTARVLLDVLAGLGRGGRQLPARLALLLRYRRLVLDASGQPGPGSELVDPAAPPTVGDPATGAGENRSVLQQLLDLLVDADRCQLFGRPLSEVILQLLAGRSVGTVDTLIGLTGNAVVRSLAGAVCPGIVDDLDALEGLRQSGSLGTLLPLARAFVSRGETRLLVDLLAALQRDYAVVLRPYEVAAADVFESGAVEALFDALDLLATGGPGGTAVRDPDTGRVVLDQLAEALGALLAQPASGVAARGGARVPSALHLVIEPARRLQDAVLARPGAEALAVALLYDLTDLLTERVLDDGGTPADPSDDVERLANPNLLPLLTRMLEHVRTALGSDRAARGGRIDAAQRALDEIAVSRVTAAVVRVAAALRDAQGAGALRASAERLLTPDPLLPDDPFGASLRLLGSALQYNVDPADLRQIARFAHARLVAPNARPRRVFEAGLRLVVADRGGLLVLLARRALLPAPPDAPLRGGAIPLEVLVQIGTEVQRAGAGAGAGGAHVQALAQGIEMVARWLRDDRAGLGRLYATVRRRGR